MEKYQNSEPEFFLRTEEPQQNPVDMIDDSDDDDNNLAYLSMTFPIFSTVKKEE